MKIFTTKVLLLIIGVFLCGSSMAGVFVTNLQATYRNGQTFLTWTCPSGTNFTYKVYRSTSILDKSNKLVSSKNLGYVIDSTSLNVRKTRKTGSKVYFTIKDGDAPLSSTTGVYVVTCDNEASYYYAVTVTDATKEYKKITVGSSSLATPIAEHIAFPQPILQGTEILGSTGETAYNYVIFGSNQKLSHFPDMFSVGSYGFNFNLIYRGNYTGGPLFIFHEGLEGNAFVGNGLTSFSDITDCIIISNDDWLPYPNGYGSTSGINTYWSGYHENFNPYKTNNTIPTSGTIRMYQQHRFMYTIDWANKFLPIDSNKVNLVGVSAGAFGVLLTAVMDPQKIAAVYSICGPIVIKSFNNDYYDLDNQMWGDPGTHLLTDVIDPATGLGYEIFDLMNIKTMMKKLKCVGLPVIYTVHGKNDLAVLWSDKPVYLSQNETNWQGGVHFWDQREHDGERSNYFDTETTPQFERFARNLSYPAFSSCDVNEDPGDGNPTNGASYGSFSGSIDWSLLSEDACNWKVYNNIKDFYVGGVLKNSTITSCYASVTVRRPQMFAPKDGETINWYNYDKGNALIQSGSFVWYTGDAITVDLVKITREGTHLELSRKNCTMKEENETSEIFSPSIIDLSISNSYNGWQVTYNSTINQDAKIVLFDVMGRIIESKNISLQEGMNRTELNYTSHGTFLIALYTANSHIARKVIY
jgi:pimeloyl-ACP methyl ester carboxylesterase